MSDSGVELFYDFKCKWRNNNYARARYRSHLEAPASGGAMPWLYAPPEPIREVRSGLFRERMEESSRRYRV